MYLLVIYCQDYLGPLIIFLSQIIWVCCYWMVWICYLFCILTAYQIWDLQNIFSHSIDCLFIIFHFVDWFFGYAEAFEIDHTLTYSFSLLLSLQFWCHIQKIYCKGPKSRLFPPCPTPPTPRNFKVLGLIFNTLIHLS